MRPALTFANLQVCNEKDKIAIFCNLSRDRHLAGGGEEMKVTQTWHSWFWILRGNKVFTHLAWGMKLITAGWQYPDDGPWQSRLPILESWDCGVTCCQSVLKMIRRYLKLYEDLVDPLYLCIYHREVWKCEKYKITRAYWSYDLGVAEERVREKWSGETFISHDQAGSSWWAGGWHI